MGFSTLSIGRTALLTSQYAINITGNNIANAASEGYSRQIVNTSAITPQNMGFGALGVGVEVDSILRVSDRYLETQLRNAYSRDQYLAAKDTCYYNIDIYFNEPSDNDISTSLEKFFDAVDDWNTHIEDSSTRIQVVQQGQNLATRFNQLGNALAQYRQRVDDEVVGLVDQVNTYINQVAQLNASIVTMESGGLTGVVANDLRDKRDVALLNLAGLMDITVTEEPNGSVVVRQASRTLVYYNITHELSTKQLKSDDMMVNVPVWAEDGSPVQVTEGQLGGMLEIRDEIIGGYQKELDTLATQLMWEVDRAHSQSAGMTPHQSATSTRAPYDTTQYLDELPYTFPYPSAYTVGNGTVDIIVYDKAKDIETTVTVEIDLDRRQDPTGERDTILWDPDHPDAENSLVNMVQRALDSAQPGVFKVGLDSTNHFYIESMSESFGFSFGQDTSGVVAALGLNTFFTGHSASSMGVNEALVADHSLLGGARQSSSSNAYVAGNNNGAQAILDIQSKVTFGQKATTIDAFYQGMVGRLGVEGARVVAEYGSQQSILMRAQTVREELSGVSLDEELTRLIQYQRSFQSASKFISTVDEMYQTLISM